MPVHNCRFGKCPGFNSLFIAWWVVFRHPYLLEDHPLVLAQLVLPNPAPHFERLAFLNNLPALSSSDDHPVTIGDDKALISSQGHSLCNELRVPLQQNLTRLKPPHLVFPINIFRLRKVYAFVFVTNFIVTVLTFRNESN